NCPARAACPGSWRERTRIDPGGHPLRRVTPSAIRQSIPAARPTLLNPENVRKNARKTHAFLGVRLKAAGHFPGISGERRIPSRTSEELLLGRPAGRSARANLSKNPSCEVLFLLSRRRAGEGKHLHGLLELLLPQRERHLVVARRNEGGLTVALVRVGEAVLGIRLQVPDDAVQPGAVRSLQRAQHEAGGVGDRKTRGLLGVLLEPVINDGSQRRV